MINLTPIVRGRFLRRARRLTAPISADACVATQAATLRSLLRRALPTLQSRTHGFSTLLSLPDEQLIERYAAAMPAAGYEQTRPMVMSMLRGQRDLLWPGRTTRFAQSSGTSDGKSKYIPITADSLRLNHFAGASDAVAAYLLSNPRSRLFSGKALILGGSFANELRELPRGVRVGDLSATLIDRAPLIASLMRVPDKHTALLPDWEVKLPALVRAASAAPVTSLSGVPSWFLILLRRVLEENRVSSLHELWPGLEVFFHGGISFEPYRAEYESFCDMSRMHFLETYNASEGFFGVQTSPGERDMQLLIDRGIYYEFSPMLPDGSWGAPLPLSAIETGKTYSLIITAPNGLWRYELGDTVRFSSLAPPKFRIAGRTKSFINAFGEELMEHNAEKGMAEACTRTGASVANYTAGPVYAESGHRGHHLWLVEFTREPESLQRFARELDLALQRANSDYQAKRAGGIFLDELQVRPMPAGFFDSWLATHGSGKLGGQRKIPRLCPTAASLARFL